jgi:ATP-dependent DNA helicase RecQ
VTTSPTTDVRAAAEAHLRALVGPRDGQGEAELRDDQWRAIEALAVGHQRALVVQRTGWGKSAVYFVATLLLRAEGAGPTVIISPLLALMRNQIAAAERAGIRAVTINSTNIESWEPIQDAIRAGEVDVLLVSPERLNNPGFRDEVLPRLAATCGLLVVDEAHCISDWGHDFRPDYRRIRTLLDELPDGIPVLATTATANARVTEDVAEQLAPLDGPSDVLVLRGSLDRESLRLGVVRLRTAEQRLAWLADHLAEQPGVGIVYCLTVAATQEIAGYLRSRGHDVAAYSGQTEATERTVLEEDLANGRVKALIATSALGMGFDSTLGFVVNMGAPQSPVAYYQQVGRAGRGTDEATVVLLPAIEDRDIWAYFASLAFPREELVRQTLEALATEGMMGTPALETRVELSRNRLETMLKVLDVDGAVRRVRGGWEATGQPWSYDAERYQRVREAREREQRAMLDYLDTDGCRMRFLRQQLDDPEATDCGRCDNCGGLSLDAAVSTEAVDEAGARLARPGVPIAPRKMWPTALATLGIDLKGKIAEPADEGRAVARLTDLGHGQALRALFRPDTPDGQVPVSLVQAVLTLLDDWRPDVDAIVVVESMTRPTLTEDLASGLSRRLQVPVVGRWAIVDSDVAPGRGAVNSAQRVAAVGRRASLQADVPDGARVLLVDDQVVTGWTLTLAARALRAAGASAVLPIALAVQS